MTDETITKPAQPKNPLQDGQHEGGEGQHEGNDGQHEGTDGQHEDPKP
jgi:hypothetical protein